MNRRYFARAFDHGIPRASSRLQLESSTDIRRDSIKQEEANDPRSGVRIFFLPIPPTDPLDPLCVKLRLTKEHDPRSDVRIVFSCYSTDRIHRV